MMKKRVVGIYNSEAAVLLEIDKLKALGHDENSIFVLANENRSEAIVDKAGIQVEEIPENGDPEPHSAGFFGKVFYALDYETQHSGVASVLKSAGISTEDVGTYVRKIENGDLVLLASEDAPRQPFSDETDSGYANEEQSMAYYETSAETTFTGTAKSPLVSSGDPFIPDDSIYPIFHEEIYVEHIKFDEPTNSTLENSDEELYRVPIFEERVQVIKEKVLTGELIVRKRKV
jgi:hypothetical protein